MRRIIPAQNNVSKVPEADILMADALRIVQNELVFYSTKSKSGKSLTLAESRVIQGYIKSLTDLSKESRERAKLDELGKMDTKDLVAALTAVMSPAEIKEMLESLEKPVAEPISIAPDAEEGSEHG